MMREGGIDVPLFQSDGPADDIFQNTAVEESVSDGKLWQQREDRI